MKKSILIFVSISLFFLYSPIFAQVEDPGDDPDAQSVPIDGYVWVMVLIALVYVFFKFRAFSLKETESKL